MAQAFKNKIKMMSPEELKQLKENLIHEMASCYLEESWRSKESLNMKIISIGRKVKQVAMLLYSEDSEEFQACKKRIFELSPHYRKKTQEEKEEDVLRILLNELEETATVVSFIPRKFGYRTRYASRLRILNEGKERS